MSAVTHRSPPTLASMMKASATSGPSGTRTNETRGSSATQASLLATKMVSTLSRREARRTISLISVGRASASTHILIGRFASSPHGAYLYSLGHRLTAVPPTQLQVTNSPESARDIDLSSLAANFP